MTLLEGEYRITDGSITIRKDVLEQWRDHYKELAINERREALSLAYLGKCDVIRDILKMFEQEEE